MKGKGKGKSITPAPCVYQVSFTNARLSVGAAIIICHRKILAENSRCPSDSRMMVVIGTHDALFYLGLQALATTYCFMR